MQYTHLGRTGLEVSRLCLGTMNFGPQTSEEDSFRIMDRALEHGINFFDTANSYGGGGKDYERKGTTEKIVGKWFAQGGGRREKVVLATKVYADMGTWPNEQKLSARNIRAASEASLRRLGTDYIDLYQMHHIDRATPWEEIWQAMELLVSQGKIVYVGSSNFAGWHIARANEAARARNFLGLVSEQHMYNLFTREPELEVLPACETYGLGVIPYSPLSGGPLGGLIDNPEQGRRSSEGVRNQMERNRDKLEAFEGLCKQLGESPAAVALAWLLHNPVITAPIIGPRTVEQLDDAVSAVSIKISDETLGRLGEIFPGPGKPAPEAYAW